MNLSMGLRGLKPTIELERSCGVSGYKPVEASL